MAYVGFDNLKGQLAHRPGVTNPGGLAAAIGQRKYGKRKMAKAAAAKHTLRDDPKNRGKRHDALARYMRTHGGRP